MNNDALVLREAVFRGQGTACWCLTPVIRVSNGARTPGGGGTLPRGPFAGVRPEQVRAAGDSAHSGTRAAALTHSHSCCHLSDFRLSISIATKTRERRWGIEGFRSIFVEKIVPVVFVSYFF